jgi:mono/diheme cytochrome c family protein
VQSERAIRRGAAAGALLILAAGAAACGSAAGRHPNLQLPGPAPVAGAGRCRAPAGAPRLVALSGNRTGSTIALVRWGGRTLALVSDTDGRAVETVDVDGRRELATTPIDGRPSQLVVLPDGRVAVANRDRGELELLQAGADPAKPLQVECAIPTPDEPLALAVTPDGQRVVVASGWGHALSAYRVASFSRDFKVELPRGPRAVVVSDDGRTAFVAHAMGGVVSGVALGGTHAVTKLRASSRFTPEIAQARARMVAELRDPKQAPVARAELAAFDRMAGQSRLSACQGYALAKSLDPRGRVLAPEVLVDPGDLSRQPSGYGNDQSVTERPAVAVIDAHAKRALDESIQGEPRMWFAAQDDTRRECLLPRAAAVDARSRTLLVACVGIDSVVAYDASAPNPIRAEKRRWRVGAGPSGIAVDEGARRAVVWSQFDRAIGVIPLAHVDASDKDDDQQPTELASFTLPENPAHRLSTAQQLGRELFYTSGDRRISIDGRACASCHPGGRDDGLVWATPNGPRRSIMLAGRLRGTAPYSWEGNEPDLRRHLSATFIRLHGAGGLDSVELKALVSYIQSLPPPPRLAPAEALTAKLRRGQELFDSASVGCAGCHSGPDFTDGELHDVGSKGRNDRERRFNTPSLLSIAGKGPYFHDGRYKTLHQLLIAEDGKMGHTKQLSLADLDALETYLRSL